MTRYTLIYICTLLMLTACGTRVPQDAIEAHTQAEIYPDYHDVTIPQNIAPLNFRIQHDGDEYVVHIHGSEGEDIVSSGPVTKIDIEAWHNLLGKNVGKEICADIYVKSQGTWQKYAPVKWTVAEEVDPWITYRLIEPSYVNFETMRICQRNIETYDEDDIYSNKAFADDMKGQCINCHAAQDYGRSGRWQMHVRIDKGGTVIADGENVKKVNLKRPETISAGVYPAWHPTLPIIVYSNNNTVQTFHLLHNNKIEVQDQASDLILYDLNTDKVSIIANDSTEWETFPEWSPDGKWLYYVSATVPAVDKTALMMHLHDNYRDIKYNIYRRAFDAETRTFGQPDTVYMASEQGLSATFPRVSPDGRYLAYTAAEYGTFHIWHHDADLHLLDLVTGESRPLTEVNSDDTESYHSWSSNGRWLLFSSRRDDGNYTRLYLAYFDNDGNGHKPFLLPQPTPDHNLNRYKSYNVPEFQAVPNTTTRHSLLQAIDNENG